MMTREEILAELKRLEPWFHRIDLGGGIFTKTESVMGEPVDHPFGPWQTIQKLLPHELSGKTVLDVGCNAGFYSFEAKRRGARNACWEWTASASMSGRDCLSEKCSASRSNFAG
jgi:hypothetical protein